MATKLILDFVYEHESQLPYSVFMTQPVGNGKTIDYTWRQTMEQARRMAAYIKTQQIEPGSRIAILSKNCAHFVMAELAIWMAGCTTVAIFPTETAETIRYVLDHSGACMLFVGKLDTWPQQASAVEGKLPCIAFPLAPSTHFESWDSIVGNTSPLTGSVQRSPSDIAILMYTSGSTGQPKGVMHSFERITNASVGITTDIASRIGETADRRVLSYLPLAHVFERAWVECASLINGKTRVFFAESLDTFIQDLNRARPTVFISVPRLWFKFQEGVLNKIPSKKLERLLGLPWIGKIVGRKVLKGLGLDQVLLAGSGSAPIPADLIAWYQHLGLNLIEGYAMTEDFAYSHNSTPAHNAPGYVGIALPGVQVRISEEGEILIKSPGQLVGYYKRPDLDAEVFTEDGYFRTGDRGELRDDGLLKITGRTKELFKTSKGKYVAPAPIEVLIDMHHMVEMSMVSGVAQSAAYGLIVLAESVRSTLSNPAVREKIETELSQLLLELNAQLPDYEQLRMLVITDTPWTIDNGFLTPTMKIRRNRIEAAMQNQLESWYSNPKPIIWA
jgi:long-subunit acyl-CoA synthetase (AMP-forming)